MATDRAADIVNEAIVFLLTGTAMIIGVGAAMGAHNPLLALGTILFGYFLVVLVHELGHAIAAWLVGWRVWIIYVAPFSLRLDDGELHIASGYKGEDFAGFVLPSPSAARHDTKWHGAIVSAGGPMASWLVAGLLIAIAYPGPTYPGDISDVRYGLYALGFFSLAAAIGSSLPLVRRGQPNDAATIQARLDGTVRHGPHAWWAIALWRYGIEPKHWNADLRVSVDAARSNPGLAWIPAYFDGVAALRARDPAAMRLTFPALGATFNQASLDILEAYLRAAFESEGKSAAELLASILSLDGVPSEVLCLRELALVEIERASGQAFIARNRLARVRTQLVANKCERQPYWKDLFEAAEARLAGA